MFYGPGGKVGNVYMKRLLELFILINIINYCGITFELLPSHQWKYSTLAQNLETWLQIQSAEAVGRIFLFKWDLENIETTIERKL